MNRKQRRAKKAKKGKAKNKKNTTVVSPQALAQTQQAPLKWELHVLSPQGSPFGSGQVSVMAHAEGVQKCDIASALADVVAQFLKDPAAVLPSKNQLEDNQKKQKVMKENPATHLFGKAKVYLCKECVDRFSDALEEEGIELPEGNVLPCSYHLDPSLKPVEEDEDGEEGADDDDDDDAVEEEDEIPEDPQLVEEELPQASEVPPLEEKKVANL